MTNPFRRIIFLLSLVLLTGSHAANAVDRPCSNMLYPALITQTFGWCKSVAGANGQKAIETCTSREVTKIPVAIPPRCYDLYRELTGVTISVEAKKSAADELAEARAAIDMHESWVHGAVPANAAVSGGTVAGAPLHICRLQMANGDWHPGTEWKGNCYVGYGGKSIKKSVQLADVLVVGRPNYVWAQPAPDGLGGLRFYPALAATTVVGQGNIYVCRTKDKDGQWRTGKAADLTGGKWNNLCYYPYGDAEIKAREFELMFPR